MNDWRIVPRDGQRDTLGEGTLWSPRDRSLYWTDILAPALNRLSLDDGHVTRWDMPQPLGWVVERRSGGFIAGLKSGIAELDLDPMAIRPILDPEPHLPGNRMNDGKADESGAIWCGTMDMLEAEQSGAFYRFDGERKMTRMDAPYGVPNGPAFSPDGRWLYHSDTALRTVFRFPRTAPDQLGAREPFVIFDQDQGFPDGMTVDAEGCLWIAHWGGGRVSRFDADGVLTRSIALPASQVTNVAFCGEDLDRLFVSSAAIGLPDSPYDGALYEVAADTPGLAAGVFPD